MSADELDLTEALTAVGYRLTTAGQVICETLASVGGHLTPDELAEAVRQREPGIGRMTVYRTLDILCDLGHVRPIYQVPAPPTMWCWKMAIITISCAASAVV